MNTSMKYRIVAVLAASAAIGTTIQCAAEETEKSVCEKKVLGRKGCEVGDFDREKAMDSKFNIRGNKIRNDFETSDDKPSSGQAEQKHSKHPQSHKQDKSLLKQKPQ